MSIAMTWQATVPLLPFCYAVELPDDL